MPVPAPGEWRGAAGGRNGDVTGVARGRPVTRLLFPRIAAIRGAAETSSNAVGTCRDVHATASLACELQPDGSAKAGTNPRNACGTRRALTDAARRSDNDHETDEGEEVCPVRSWRVPLPGRRLRSQRADTESPARWLGSDCDVRRWNIAHDFD